MENLWNSTGIMWKCSEFHWFFVLIGNYTGIFITMTEFSQEYKWKSLKLYWKFSEFDCRLSEFSKKCAISGILLELLWDSLEIFEITEELCGISLVLWILLRFLEITKEISGIHWKCYEFYGNSCRIHILLGFLGILS